MDQRLIPVALRYQSLYLPDVRLQAEATAESLSLVASLARNGFGVDERLMQALNGATAEELEALSEGVNEAMRTEANWTPLVKGWLKPTGETSLDHLLTLFCNLIDNKNLQGTTLPCGHFIPAGTFDLNRYNGCPFCGKPFEFTPGSIDNGLAPRRILGLMDDESMRSLLISLLTSPVPLDAGQALSLDTLLEYYGVPEPCPQIDMLETRLVVSAFLYRQSEYGRAFSFLRRPYELLRLIRFIQTGDSRLRKPAVYRAVMERARVKATYFGGREVDPEVDMLAFRFDRAQCRAIAQWLENLPQSAEAMAEDMHPQRGTWVRFIRAARLSEFARRSGYPKLRRLLDVLYNGNYSVWAGHLEKALENGDPAALEMLSSRPGIFARRLFFTMLRYGFEEACAAFYKILPEIPSRLLLALTTYADNYFLSPWNWRLVVPGHGNRPADVPVNRLLENYSEADRADMVAAVKVLFMDEMRRRYELIRPKHSGTVYIDPVLFDVPVPAGDRAQMVNVIGGALQGQRFKVEGDRVRLFMQWGIGLPAQYLDMDLSARVYGKERSYYCSYYELDPPGCHHSGDIRCIPDRIGTAEYIELDLPELRRNGASYVAFTCNAYSDASICCDLVVGWMSCEEPMKVSDETGVAYDPAAVQMMVKVSGNNLAEGLVFGFLDLATNEITWLEMPFAGFNVEGLDEEKVMAYLRRLRAKPSVGELLALRAEAFGQKRVDEPSEATEVFSTADCIDTAALSRTLLP